MLFSNVLSTLLILISSALLITAGVVSERNDAAGVKAPFAAYTMAENVIKGEIFGHKYELNGTASQVLAQLEKIHGADKLAAAYAAETKTAASDWTPPSNNGTSTGADKRNLIWGPDCIPVKGHSWTRYEGLAIQQMVKRLDQVGGSSYVSAHTCAIIECNNLGVTWLCNDRDNGIAPGNKYLATYVDALVHKCWEWTIWPVYWEAGGQMFDTDNYNVVSIGGDCGSQI